MSKYLRAFGFIFTLAALLAVFWPQQAMADEDDPPSRVARLSYIHGNLSFQPGGTDDWVTVALNRPVTTGDKIWADNDSRAELHIGSASLRLSSNTGFSFLNLSDNVTQIRLTQGTLRVRIKRMDENETFEVDTPNLAFSALRPGIYRIRVNEGGDTTIVKVRDGQGEVTGGGSAYNIRAHEVGSFTGTDQISADVESFGNDDDDFDRWCGDRDRHEDTSVSARYVSRDVIGYEDLDDFGGWRPVAGYGTVWFPHTTVVGWAPYHYGHWAYVYPWGYTWVDDAPWGFAPFHYGRWIFVSGVWGWVPAPPPAPGVVYVRPVYAPALVAWVGGPHFSIGVSIGGGAAAVGWFPLGPREVYVPTYHVSQHYVQNVNVSNTTVNNTVVNNYYNNVVVNRNVTVVRQTYVNQTVPGAVAATTPQAFSSAQSVSRNVVSVNARDAASAPVSAASPTAAPSKQAVMGAGAAAQVRPSAASLNRPVVAKVQPPPPPVAFARQQQAFTANGGKPPAMAQVRQMQAANVQQQQVHPNVKIAPPAPPAQSATPRNAQTGGNQPGQKQQGFNNNSGNTPGNNLGNNKPPAAVAPVQPAATNQPGNAGGNGNASRKTFEDRPPAARPSQGNNQGNISAGTNPALDQKHQQELQQLRAKQDQERQKVEQQQVQERQRLAQQNADQQKQRDLNQQHQQQLQNLENRHAAQDQKLQDKHQQERKKQDSQQPKNKGDHPGHER